MSRPCFALPGAVVLLGLIASAVFAQAPKTIGFTGLLTDKAGKPLDGDYPVRLALYASSDPTVTTALWSDDKTVHATHGLFSTALGDHTAFPASLDFSQALFVGVSVNGEPEMQPRLALQGVPYALFAQTAANLKTPVAVSGSTGAYSPVFSVTNSDGGQAILGINTSTANTATGVYGQSAGAAGVVGVSQANNSIGVEGAAQGANGFGVAGVADNGAIATGVYGQSAHGWALYGKTTDGWAGQFEGKTLFDGQLQLGAGKEIFFKDLGQIRSLDDNHRILFRRNENKLELREIGDLIFSPGASGGQETDKVVMTRTGRVGIGTGIPVGLVDVFAAPNGPGGQVVDQQQTLNESYGGLGPGSTLGQSFVAGATGNLTRIDLDASGFGNGAFTGTLSLYAGNTPTGTLLATYNISGAAGAASWRELDFSPGFAVTAGQPYTWLVNITGTNGLTILGSPKDGYPYGVGYMNGTAQGSFDFAFRTYVTVPAGPMPTHALFVDPVTANVGIGTTSPAAALDVRGDVRLGSTGQYHAAGGADQLLIYQTVISVNDGMLSGTGISALHTGPGSYHMTVNHAFAWPPAMLVTPFTLGTPASAVVSNISYDYAAGQTSFDVLTYVNGTKADSAFSILVAGAR